MEALEASQRERQHALHLAGQVSRVECATLGRTIVALEDGLAAALAGATAAAAEAESQHKAQLNELRREGALSKRKATELLLEREKETVRLQTMVRQLQTREAPPNSAQSAQSARDVAAAQATIAALRHDVTRLQRQREEWQLRNLELHQAMRATSKGAALGSDGAAERILEVAKQQAQRDEELMAARIQVNELQAQLVEARELHNALRERCGDFERQLARTEHGGGLENMEYLKNIIYKLFVMEEGLEKLLPVVATFLQFSPEEMARIKEARASFTTGDKGGGGSLFGVLGEDWLFGEQKKRAPRKASAPRSGAEQQGGAWQELEQAWKKTQRLKQLLFASQSHVESYAADQQHLRDALAVLQTRLAACGADASLPAAALPPPPIADKVSPQLGSKPPAARGPTVPTPATVMPHHITPESSTPALGWDAAAVADDAIVGSGSTREQDAAAAAEEAAELALERELEADSAARALLEAAIRSGREEDLQVAVVAMQERGLDADDARLDEARLALEALQHIS